MPIAEIDDYRILIDLNKLIRSHSKEASITWCSKKVTVKIEERGNGRNEEGVERASKADS